MLENQKTVILSIINNKALFAHELTKSIVWLSTKEIEEFEAWVIANFWDTHENEIMEVFGQANA
jgi:hypothetical protein